MPVETIVQLPGHFSDGVRQFLLVLFGGPVSLVLVAEKSQSDMHGLVGDNITPQPLVEESVTEFRRDGPATVFLFVGPFLHHDSLKICFFALVRGEGVLVGVHGPPARKNDYIEEVGRIVPVPWRGSSAGIHAEADHAGKEIPIPNPNRPI